MCVDLFGGRTLVQADEPVEKVITCCIIAIAPGEIREVVLEWRARQLFGEEIDFIQEQNLSRVHQLENMWESGRTLQLMS